jgi:xanthine/CO dehydrogenase XdhC/CoxF family maturation factor
VTGTVGLIFLAALLSGLALASYGWLVSRIDPEQPARLIGELRMAQLAAILLAVTGGSWIGLAVHAAADPLANVDVTVGIATVVVAVVALRAEPRQALLLLAAGFVVHALIDIAHRPGGLSTTLAPRPFIVGCAAYDAYIAAICFWTRRR